MPRKGRMKIPKNLGTILLAAFLILFGVIELVPGLGGQIFTIILAIVAIAAGIFILIQR